MDKYQRLFIKQMKEKIKTMTTPGQSTTEAELYRLLHSAKGTSGTIGLDDWYQSSSQLIEDVEAEGTRVWEADEVQQLFAPLAFLLLSSEEEQEIESAPEISAEAVGSRGTLLIVDDDLSLLQMLKDQLERAGYMVLATPDADRALELFYSMKPDCVVLDIILQERSGFDVLQEMQARSEQYLIPVVLISTSTDRETRIRAYESGADDFIGKPLDVEEFKVRIGRQVARRLKLNAMLMTDELTGAYNSTYLAQELVRHLQRLPDMHQPAVLTLFDLDSFRYINERFGYTEGDRLLQYFSNLVKPSLGPQDIWARDRYDRFYLLQPGIGEKEAASFANQLLKKLQGEEQRTGDEHYYVSFSAGVLELKPGMTAESCYDRILRIVAEAKRSREGIMIVPERRKAQTRVVDSEAYTIKHDHDSETVDSQRESNRLDSVVSSITSRLKRHARKGSIFGRDEDDNLSSPNELSSAIKPDLDTRNDPLQLAAEVELEEAVQDEYSSFRADTIREIAATDSTDRRLEWMGSEEKVLLNRQTVEVENAPVPPADIRLWRLAIIDDDELIRNMLTKRLSSIDVQHEIEIKAFSDGEDFFSDPWHDEDTQYLLILDRMMPRMNGMEVLRRLRSGENRSRYTVLMLTGVGDDREVAEAIRAGTDDYLTKPFSVVELEARIRRLLGRMRA